MYLGILDTGADKIMIPKTLADNLGLSLEPAPRPFGTAGGLKKGFIAKIEKVQFGRVIFTDFQNVEVGVLDDEIPILIGRKPFFEEFVVVIKEREKYLECIRYDAYEKKKKK